MAFWSDWSDGKKWLMGITGGVATAAGATIVTGLLASGTNHFLPPRVDTSRSKICSETATAGYPLGRWKVRGVQVRDGRPDTTFGDDIIFDTRTNGTWFQGLGKQRSDGTYPKQPEAPFTASQSPAPGAKITLTFNRKEKFTPEEDAVATPLDRVYSAEEVVVVRADGCSMDGYSKQSESGGNIAVIVDYCWTHSECPPLPQSEGWRAPMFSRRPKGR